MKKSILPLLLCTALLAALSACGGGTAASPDASAQAAFSGEWVSYADYTDEKSVPYEDFSWSVTYTLREDGTLTYNGTNGSAAEGTWSSAKDGGVSLKTGGETHTLAPLSGKSGIAELRASDGSGKTALAARTDTATGRAALKQREAALQSVTDVDGETQRTFTAWCSVSEADGQTFLDADELIWVDGTDTDALALFGIDPESVYDDYTLYDADETPFSYEIGESATFIVYLDAVRSGANRSGFITFAKKSGKLLAKVTTVGQTVTAVEQIYIP